jgi:hypothetical protein
MSGIQGVFGFMRGGGAGYAYVGMSDNNSASIVKTTDWGASGTGTRWTAISPQAPSAGSTGIIGVVADGQFIANTGYYSTNNGASWTQWQNMSSTRYFPPGLNGSIAYSTTSKRAFSFRLLNVTKYGGIVCYPSTVSSTGSVITSTSFLTSTSGSGQNVMWSPVFNYFYFNGYGTNSDNYRYINAASPSTSGAIGIGSAVAYRPGISHDGYPLIPFRLVSNTYQLRKYTSADLSTYDSYGNITDSYYNQVTQSPWIFYPVANKYLIAAGQGATITIREATSAAPQNLSVLSSFGIAGGASSVQSVQISEDPVTGRILCGGVASFNLPKGGSTVGTYTYLSVDGGTTWTNYLQTVMGASKNFT